MGVGKKRESSEEKYVGKKKERGRKRNNYMKEELDKKAKMREPIIH